MLAIRSSFLDKTGCIDLRRLSALRHLSDSRRPLSTAAAAAGQCGARPQRSEHLITLPSVQLRPTPSRSPTATWWCQKLAAPRAAAAATRAYAGLNCWQC